MMGGINLKLATVKEILNAEVVTGEQYLNNEVKSAFGCDLMSDVLAFIKEETVLLTGLANPQVIRTAEMIDVYAIVFVRGKRPSRQIVEMAEQRNITLMTTDYILYTACGKLYEKGLRGVNVKGDVVDD